MYGVILVMGFGKKFFKGFMEMDVVAIWNKFVGGWRYGWIGFMGILFLFFCSFNGILVI